MNKLAFSALLWALSATLEFVRINLPVTLADFSFSDAVAVERQD